ncbi:MAG: fibronectin type III domain-containing protein [Balneolaceae bacterium]|nr:fibronectin type III domain-containing protein [Balneolaceae bacterium]
MRQLESTFKLLPIFGLLLLFYSGCGTEPKFERVNANDPQSQFFSPKTGRFFSGLNSDKTVRLSWNDISDFESGYLIWKGLGDNSDKILLAELDANETNYVDESGELDKITTYFLAAKSEYVSNYDSLNSKNVLINFTGGIEDLTVNREGNIISLYWDNTSIISDFVTVNRIYQNSESEILDTLNREVESFQFTNLEEDYSTQLVVSTLLINHNNEPQIIHSNTTGKIFYNTPRIHSILFENEAIAKIEFEDNSPFDDQILVYQRSRRNSSYPYSNWAFADTLNKEDGRFKIKKTTNRDYQFSLIANYNGLESTRSGVATKSPGSSPPKDIQIEEIAEKTIRISWVDANPPEFTHKYFLDRRNGDYGSYSTIAELDAGVNSYIIDDITPAYIEHFRIRTYSSGFRTFTYDGRN